MRKTTAFALSALFLAHPKFLKEPGNAAGIFAKWHNGTCEISGGYLKITGEYGNNGILYSETRTVALDQHAADKPLSLFCSEDLVIIAYDNRLFVSRGTIVELIDPSLTGISSTTYKMDLEKGDTIIGGLKTPAATYIAFKKGKILYQPKKHLGLYPLDLLAYQIYNVKSVSKSDNFDIQLWGEDLFGKAINLGISYNSEKGILEISNIRAD